MPPAAERIRLGQIWTFDPANQKLEMVFESPGAPVLNMPDNLCVSPRGGLVICEDSDYGKFAMQRMHGLNQDGKLSVFAVNNVQLNGEKTVSKAISADGNGVERLSAPTEMAVCQHSNSRDYFCHYRALGKYFVLVPIARLLHLFHGVGALPMRFKSNKPWSRVDHARSSRHFIGFS